MRLLAEWFSDVVFIGVEIYMSLVYVYHVL